RAEKTATAALLFGHRPMNSRLRRPIVLASSVLLLTSAILSLGGLRQHQRAVNSRGLILTLGNAAVQYYAENRHSPADLQTMISAGYIRVSDNGMRLLDARTGSIISADWLRESRYLLGVRIQMPSDAANYRAVGDSIIDTAGIRLQPIRLPDAQRSDAI